MDYDTYAEGEAMLGWLNATLSLHILVKSLMPMTLFLNFVAFLKV